MLPNARSNRPPRLRLLRQLRKRPLLPISIGCTRTDELCTEPGCARCFRYGSSPVAACVAHRLLHATVGPAFQRLQLPHPSHLEPSPVSSLNWAGRPVPLVIRIRKTPILGGPEGPEPALGTSLDQPILCQELRWHRRPTCRPALPDGCGPPSPPSRGPQAQAAQCKDGRPLKRRASGRARASTCSFDLRIGRNGRRLCRCASRRMSACASHSCATSDTNES